MSDRKGHGHTLPTHSTRASADVFSPRTRPNVPGPKRPPLAAVRSYPDSTPARPRGPALVGRALCDLRVWRRPPRSDSAAPIARPTMRSAKMQRRSPRHEQVARSGMRPGTAPSRASLPTRPDHARRIAHRWSDAAHRLQTACGSTCRIFSVRARDPPRTPAPRHFSQTREGDSGRSGSVGRVLRWGRR
jgi:hypothetical protein